MRTKEDSLIPKVRDAVLETLGKERRVEQLAEEIVRGEQYDNQLRQLEKSVENAMQRLATTQASLRSTWALVEWLLQLLRNRGLIDEVAPGEDEVVAVFEGKLNERLLLPGMGIAVAPEGTPFGGWMGDGKRQERKEVVIDCARRVHVCQAVCCYQEIALAREEVLAGLLPWNPDRPFLVRRDEDGACPALDRRTHICTLRERRPIVCRWFNCEDNRAIWSNFARVELAQNARDFLGRLASNRAGAATATVVSVGFQSSQEGENP